MASKLSWVCTLSALLLWSGCRSPRAMRAYEQISALREGALLVRLPAPDHTAGPQADSIVRAFQRHYDFSPVYFGMATQADSLYRAYGQDGSLQPLGDSPGSPIVLLAEFGTVYETPLLSGPEGERRQVGGVGGLPGLVVKTLDGIQLDDPFPYRVNTNIRAGNLGWAVQTLNRRLQQFYLKAQRRLLNERYREGK